MKVGQRIKFTRCIQSEDSEVMIGKIGRVLVEHQLGSEEGRPLVEFENWHRGHTGEEAVPHSDSCWWCKEESLEICNFHPGDIVYTNPLPETIRHEIHSIHRLIDRMCQSLRTGVVLEIENGGIFTDTLVEFDDSFTDGHDGYSLRVIGREDGCRWVKSGELVLYKERRTFENMSALSGDRILVDEDYTNNLVAGKIGKATGNVNNLGKIEAMFEGTATLFHIPRDRACLIPSIMALNCYRRDIQEREHAPHVSFVSAQEEVVHFEVDTETNKIIYERTEEIKNVKKEKKIKCELCGSNFIKRTGGIFGGIVKKEKIEAIGSLLGKELKHVCWNCSTKFTKCNECGQLQDLRDGISNIGGLWVVTAGEMVLLCKKCKVDLEGEIVRCSYCHEYLFRDEGEWREDEPYCPRCYEEKLREETDIYDYQRGKSGYKEMPFTTFTKLPQRNYGVEIETHCNEGDSIPKESIRPWLRYEDGSLGYNGEEFASPIFAGDAGLKEIVKLLEMLRSNGYYVESDCAVHCHVDAKDYKFRDVKRFLLFMHDYEEIIYSFLRRPCTGGVPRLRELVGRDMLRRVTGWKKLKKALYGRERVESHSKWGDIRYRGLNVHSYFFRKTFEFRYLGKTLYTNEICNFARFAVFTVENGRRYKTTKKIIKPTLKEMAHILQFPKDLHEYLVEAQKTHDEHRHVVRLEGERK